MAVESTSTSDLHFIGTRKKPSFFFETTIPHHSCCYWVLPSFRSDFHFIGRRLFPLGAVTGVFTDFFTEFFRYYWVLPSFFFKLSFEWHENVVAIFGHNLTSDRPRSRAKKMKWQRRTKFDVVDVIVIDLALRKKKKGLIFRFDF